MDPVHTLCSIPFFKDVDPSVDKLTKPKWNFRPISWPRPLRRRPIVSRLDAKPNSNSGYQPLRREWVGRCPLTKSMKENDRFKMTRPFNKRTRTIYRHPSWWTSGQTFRPFVPCHIPYPTLNEIIKQDYRECAITCQWINKTHVFMLKSFNDFCGFCRFVNFPNCNSPAIP